MWVIIIILFWYSSGAKTWKYHCLPSNVVLGNSVGYLSIGSVILNQYTSTDPFLKLLFIQVTTLYVRLLFSWTGD